MRRWGVVVAIGLAIIMFAIDMNIVALALPVMGQTFQQTDEAMSMAMLSYSIPLTILMIPSGLIVTRWPPLTIFLIGVGGFGCASILCALAPSFTILLIGRAIQGIFGALIGTQGFAVVAAAIKPHERGRAMGIIGSMGPLGTIMGPGIGGILLANWGWSAIFWINIPITIVTMAIALFSFPGVTFGPSSNSGLGQMKHLLGHPRFLTTLLILLAFSTGGGALAYLLTFTLQDVHQLDLVQAGATLLIPSLAMALMGPLGGYLTDRFGVRLLLPAGWVITLVGILALLLAIATPSSMLDLGWRLFLMGLGNGMAYGPLLALMMSIGPRETLGSASALSGVTRQLGFICGPLLVSLLWSWQLTARATERAWSSIWLLIALALIGLACALFTAQGSTSSVPEEIPAEEATVP